MNGFIADDYKKAMDLMFEARKILFHQLHCPGGLSKELIEGVDKLGLSFEFAENPDASVMLCPQCECLYWEETEKGTYKCLCCDHEWMEKNE